MFPYRKLWEQKFIIFAPFPKFLGDDNKNIIQVHWTRVKSENNRNPSILESSPKYIVTNLLKLWGHSSVKWGWMSPGEALDRLITVQVGNLWRESVSW